MLRACVRHISRNGNLHWCEAERAITSTSWKSLWITRPGTQTEICVPPNVYQDNDQVNGQIGEDLDAQIGVEVLQSLMNRGQKETEH